MGGPAPVRRFLPDLMDLVLSGKIKPGKVFDLTLPLAQVAEGYRAMDRAAGDQDVAHRVNGEWAEHIRRERCVTS